MAKKSNAPINVGTECGFCAYIGPTLQGVIQNGTLYDSPKSEVIKDLAFILQRFPLIEKLIVSGDALVEAKINIKRPGNIMYVNYHKLATGKF